MKSGTIKNEPLQVCTKDNVQVWRLTFGLDRERDVNDVPGADQTSQPPKRPRINRERYKSVSGTSFPLAKKLLQADPQAGDKSRSGRKD